MSFSGTGSTDCKLEGLFSILMIYVYMSSMELANSGAGEEGRCTVVRSLGPVAHVEDPAHLLVFS